MAENKEKFKESMAFKTLPTDKSKDTEWIKWIDLVMSKYGRSLGAQIFLAAWGKRGSSDANTYALRHHLKSKYNIEIDESVFNKIADLGGGISGLVGKYFKVSKYVFAGTAALVVIVVLGVVYGYAKGNPLPIGPGGLAGAALKAGAGKGGK